MNPPSTNASSSHIGIFFREPLISTLFKESGRSSGAVVKDVKTLVLQFSISCNRLSTCSITALEGS